MAKITYEAGLGNYGEIQDFYDAGLNLQNNKSSPTKVVYKDTGAGSDKIDVLGTGLEWDGDFMTAGTITGFNFTNQDGNVKYMTLRGLSLSVEDFNGAYVGDGLQGVIDLVLRGNDTITGSKKSDLISSGDGKDTVKAGIGNDTVLGGAKGDKLYGEKGNDYIWGDSGNDRMWGGPGSDKFQFQEGDGKDVIVDFDAKGGGKNQDYIALYEGETFSIKNANKGRDTLLDFGDGDTLLLLGVHKSDFTKGGDIYWLDM
ncbi:calcium-binding protein [Rhizobium sp.]